MVRISYGSLFFAYLCCVLNHFFYILGLWGRRFRNFISITLNYLHSPSHSRRPSLLSILHTSYNREGSGGPLGFLFPVLPAAPHLHLRPCHLILKVSTSQASDVLLITFYWPPVPDLFKPHLLLRKMNTEQLCGKIPKQEHSNFERF